MRKTGKIIKGVGGRYEVYTDDGELVICQAKGILRYHKECPLIGDNVVLETDEAGLGNIVELLPRTNSLIRPAVANVDQALIVCAVHDPEFHPNLLDRFLILMQKQQVPVLICFNKADLAKEGEAERLCDIYRDCGAKTFVVQAEKPETLADVRTALLGKTTVLAGPSGVGKSTIMNVMQPDANMETGTVSEKIRRGKHTTRHTQLFFVEKNTYLCDTPGFSSLYLPDVKPEDLALYYEEFTPYRDICRYPDCLHRKEPGCAVRNAVEDGAISRERYDSYELLFTELSGQRIIYSRKPKHEEKI